MTSYKGRIFLTLRHSHSSMVLSALIILRPWVRIPGTPSMLFFILDRYSVEIIFGMRKGQKYKKKWPGLAHI